MNVICLFLSLIEDENGIYHVDDKNAATSPMTDFSSGNI